MVWLIECNNSSCQKKTKAFNIVDLIDNNTNTDGWFICSHCKNEGHIKKSFKLQEKGEIWEPYLRGTIRLGNLKDTYQPFVFIVSYEPTCQPTNYWFSYYKDLRKTGGRLKLGYGPGGPPVLDAKQIIQLLDNLQSLELIDRLDIIKLTN